MIQFRLSFYPPLLLSYFHIFLFFLLFYSPGPNVCSSGVLLLQLLLSIVLFLLLLLFLLQEPDFNDPEDFEDDISDEELMPEIMKMKPNESDGVDSVILIDNVPCVEVCSCSLHPPCRSLT